MPKGLVVVNAVVIVDDKRMKVRPCRFFGSLRSSFFFCVFARVVCLRRDVTESDTSIFGQMDRTLFLGRTQDRLSFVNVWVEQGQSGHNFR